MLITLEREGSFPVQWSHSNKYQCGNRGTPIVDFKVKVYGTDDDLNRDGWLLDNNDIPRYFAETYARVKDFQSCERIARRAARDLCAIAKSNGARLRKVVVAVSAIKGSWITAEWHDARRPLPPQ